MCGRFLLEEEGQRVWRAFPLGPDPAPDERLPTGPEVCPGRWAPALIGDAEGGLASAHLSFGWPRPGGRKGLLINARLETAASLPTYRAAWRSRRCVVPVAGFFEWTKDTRPKRKLCLRRADGEPFGLAGLWRPAAAGSPLAGALVILTEGARAPVDAVHDRMPVMVAAGAAPAFVRGRAPDDLGWPRMDARDLVITG